MSNPSGPCSHRSLRSKDGRVICLSCRQPFFVGGEMIEEVAKAMAAQREGLVAHLRSMKSHLDLSSQAEEGFDLAVSIIWEKP